ncbi:MAG: tRNA dihydrouridine synthase DusB [Spirochaetia bacterium]
MAGSYCHPLAINNIVIPGNLFLAPMAGFTDKGFRKICINHGADFTFTEMISAEGLIRNNRKTAELAERADNEEIIGFQLFASSPGQAAEAAALLSSLNPTLIDLNCGCPVPKVTKSGCGAALMKTPKLLADIIRAVKKTVRVPVSVKIRSGWEKDALNYLETGAAASESGADLITIHPRTRSQGYSGKADHSHTERLKSSLQIPVIASGDIFCPEDAKTVLENTRCDGVMIARGAVGNPWIFSRIKNYLVTGELSPEPSVSDQLDTAFRHLLLSADYYGENKACREMRKHIAAYTKGFPGGAALRKEIVKAGTIDEYRILFDRYRERMNEQ